MVGNRKGDTFLDEVMYPRCTFWKIDMVRLDVGGDGVACFLAAFRL